MSTKRRTPRRRSGRRAPEGLVVRFPPLPRIPAPPRSGVDPRQGRADQIIAGIAQQVSGSFEIAHSNTRTGFPAASIDIGKLKAALESGLARMEMSQVRERWSEDVRDWMFRVLSGWVQRCKQVQLKPRENGIEVELETQDDLGYYHYRFDVFAPRKSPKVQRSPR